MRIKLDPQRVRFIVLATSLAGLAAIWGQPYISGNEKAIDVIVNAFSILAGFLVAIIAVIGDPALLPQGTWRIAEASRHKMRARLIRYKWLFVLYLATLALIFLAQLLSGKFPILERWIQSLFLFFGVLAFTFSLRLPSALINAQQEKIDTMIEQRRAQEGIAPSENTERSPSC